MPAPFDAPANTTHHPRGSFEIAPEFEGEDAHPLDVIYEYFISLCKADENGAVNIKAQLLRGITEPQGYVDLWCSEHTSQTSCRLALGVEQARAFATTLITAADDVDAALAKLATDKQGGAA